MSKPDTKLKQVNGPDDVHQQTELLVLDYLRGSRYMKTMDALTKWITDKKKQRSSSAHMSPMASDIFAKDAAANKETKDRASSVLEFMIGKRKSNTKSPKVSCSPDDLADGKVDETAVASTTLSSKSGREWTKEDVSKLKKEAKKTQAITDKTERWKTVGAALGRSKRECYEKYKELKKKSPSSKDAKDKHQPVTVDVKGMLDLSAIDVAAEEDGASDADKPTSKTPKARGKASPTNPVSVQYVKDKASTSPVKPGKNKVDIEKEGDSLQSSSLWCSGDVLVKAKQRGSAVVPGDARACRSSDLAVMEDIDNMDEDDDKSTSRTAPPPRATGSLRSSSSSGADATKQGKALPAAEVTALRKLLFNDTKKKLSSHWTHQGFGFTQVEGLKYGIVQHEGGPCGVMAVVQAFVLHFLFKEDTATWDSVTPSQVSKALCQALAHIIWQAGTGATCKVALLAGDTPALEHATVALLHSRHELEQFVSAHIDQFRESKGYGAVLLVASVMLTRGLATIEADMDSATGTVPTLIGAHDYCTQEMVNLLLLGYACSNVFDGSKDLGGDGASSMVLRGVQKRGVVGFLTLFEAYDYMVVGDHLKSPADNIWVVCSESHYSVLFADPASPIVSSPTSSTTFDLFYFDGLANQDEVIRLTIQPLGLPAKPDKASAHKGGDLTPPLNLVVQTKWPQATVDWHSVEPLL